MAQALGVVHARMRRDRPNTDCRSNPTSMAAVPAGARVSEAPPAITLRSGRRRVRDSQQSASEVTAESRRTERQSSVDQPENAIG
jgi:hypothetical protein